MITYAVTGATTVIEYFGKTAGSSLPDIVSNGINHFGEELLFTVKAYASGAPGPEVITGVYRDSISSDITMSGVVGQADVFTDMNFGYRLEYGGVSTTQGKELVTRPYPHFRPALMKVGQEFTDYLERTVGRL